MFFAPPLDITLQQWDAAFDSRAKAFLVGVREAIPLMGAERAYAQARAVYRASPTSRQRTDRGSNGKRTYLAATASTTLYTSTSLTDRTFSRRFRYSLNGRFG